MTKQHGKEEGHIHFKGAALGVVAAKELADGIKNSFYRKLLSAEKEAQLIAKKATKRSKMARSRVLMQQGYAKLNLMGNFSNDSFNSLTDEATGILTMLTVYVANVSPYSKLWGGKEE